MLRTVTDFFSSTTICLESVIFDVQISVYTIVVKNDCPKLATKNAV